MMVLKRFFDTRLAQASYLIGSSTTHEAIVIDANRDVEAYIAAAAGEGVEIRHVTETHIHADYVSGSRELAARTGARLYLSDEGGADWKYAFARESGAVLLEDGDVIDVADVRVQAVHTPGHTPEHLMFVITDTSSTTEPVAAVTGDFVFAGDVGRPDLLERAAGVAGSMEASARALYRSLQRLDGYPDYLQIWPGHGAGSACGKGIGSLPYSTLGYERRVNWAFQVAGEDEFVRRVLAGQPDPPRYFADMKRINKAGPPPLGGLPSPPRLNAAAIEALQQAGGTILDTRPAAQFAAAHLPRALNIPLGKSFTTWAGWLVPGGDELVLVSESEMEVREAARDLALIGIDRIRGHATGDVLDEWRSRGRPLASLPHVDAAAAAREIENAGAVVLDVRNEDEWNSGHIPGAVHVPLGYLPERLASVPVGHPVVVHCQGGTRSAIAASLLAAHGVSPVLNMAGGLKAWQAAGLPITAAYEAAPLG